MLNAAICSQEGLGKDLELLYVGCLQVDIPSEEQEVRDLLTMRSGGTR